jgi:hypothetical protein
MRCNDAYLCLLGCRERTELSRQVRRHLHCCDRCTRRWQRLRRLDRETRLLPVPADNPRARALVLQKIGVGVGPTVPPPSVPASGRPPRHRRLAFLSAALVLLGLGLGWFFWTRSLAPPHLPTEPGPQPPRAAGPPPAPPPKRPKPPEPVAPREVSSPLPEDYLLTSALEHTLRLADPSSPDEPVRVLADLAADLRRGAVSLARGRRSAQLDETAGLYEQVCQGLVGRAQAPLGGVPPEDLTTLFVQLQDDRQALSRAAEQAPEAAGPLQGMAAAARQALRDLRDRARSAPTQTSGAGSALLPAVVRSALRLAEERDPLRRADCCADAADRLVEAIVQASAAGRAERASRLATSLGALMERGVRGNLARVPVGELDPLRQVRVERLCRWAGQSAQVLRAGLARAPANVRRRLQHLLADSGRWHEQTVLAGRWKERSDDRTASGTLPDGPGQPVGPIRTAPAIMRPAVRPGPGAPPPPPR